MTVITFLEWTHIFNDLKETKYMIFLIESLQSLFERDLKRLKREIELYEDENKLWLIDKKISNSTGNLCLHLCGNLQHYVGNNLGKSGYARNRDYEFSAKNVSRSELLAELERTQKIVRKTLSTLEENDLEKAYPQEVFGHEMKTDYFLIHLTGHLNYHLGQINFHRRMFN